MAGPLFLGEDEHSLLMQDPAGRPVVLPKNALQASTLDQMRALTPGTGGQSVAPTPYADTAPQPFSGVGIQPPAPQQPEVPPPVQPPAPQPDVSRETSGGSYSRSESRPQASVLGQSYDALQANLQGQTGRAARYGAQQDALTAQQQVAARGAAEAKAQGYQQQADVLQGAAQATQDYDRRIAMVEAQRSQRMAEEQGKLADVQQQIADRKIDPSRVWHSFGAGEKIGAGIAMAMSAIGNALTGQGGAVNGALAMIQNTVDRDIAAQREAVAGMRDDLAAKTNLFGLMRTKFADDRQAEAAARSGLLQAAQMKAEQYKAAAGSAEARANGDALIAGLGQQGLQNKAQFDNQANAQIQQGLGLGIHAEQNADQIATSERVAAAKAAGERVKGDREAKTIEGLEGYAKSENAYTKAQEFEGSYQTLMPMIREQKALREKYGVELMRSPAAARAQQNSALMLMELKNAFQLGVLSGPDEALLNKINPNDPTAVGWIMERLDNLQAKIESGTNAKLRVLGFKNRQRDYDPAYALPSEKDVDVGDLGRPPGPRRQANGPIPAPAAPRPVYQPPRPATTGMPGYLG